MALLVLKFGGSSLSDVERIKSAAAKIAAEAKQGHKLVVVVSAMAGATDQLIGFCRAIAPVHDMREQDAVAATGEQITAGLMAIALQQRGLRARSWQGWQIPLQTDTRFNAARIENIPTAGLQARLDQGEVAVIAGYQGLGPDGSITTLGRGGSDTTAVALAAALKAERCDIYTDLDGVYTADPRIVSKARRLPRISHEEMLELISLGAHVLQPRAAEMALRHRVPVQILSTFGNAIGSQRPGTLVTDEGDPMEKSVVTGIAASLNDGKITLEKIQDRPGFAASLFGALARAGIGVDMIVQTAATDQTATEHAKTDLTFTTRRTDIDRALQIIESERAALPFGRLLSDKNVAKISVVGIGMRSHPGVAATMFEALAAKQINITAIETSEITISVLIAEDYAELAVRSLHQTFGLDNV